MRQKIKMEQGSVQVQTYILHQVVHVHGDSHNQTMYKWSMLMVTEAGGVQSKKTCWEGWTGKKLEKGKIADYVVLSQNIMTAPVDRILETKVIATVIDGELAFGRL